MKRSALTSFFMISALIFGVAGQAHADGPADTPEILISAASSLTDVITSLKPEAERRCGVKILLNFGASGSLRAQIESGAPVDLFFSAAPLDMDKLQAAGLLAAGSRKDVLINSIVMVGDRNVAREAGYGMLPVTDTDSLRSLLSGAKLLAIGNPDTVPAGRYAMQALESLGLKTLVEKKLVYGGNVRQVLSYVSSGSAPLGIVFKTDALTLPQGGDTTTLFEFPTSASDLPRYPLAMMAGSKHKDAAARVAEFLSGPDAAAVFAAAGFGRP